MSLSKKIFIALFLVLAVSGVKLYKIMQKNPYLISNKYYSYYQALKSIDNGVISRFLPDPERPEFFLVKSLSFQKIEEKIKSSSDWVYKTIDNDFANYVKFDEGSAYKTYENSAVDDSFVLFTIKDGQVSYEDKNPDMNAAARFAVEYYRGIFEYLAKRGLIGDLVFNFRFSDNTIKDYSDIMIKDLSPIIAVTKDSTKHIDQYSILIPDWQNLMSWLVNQPLVKNANKESPWETKMPVIFWRGGEADVTGYRHKVVELSASMGHEKLDAQFTYGPNATTGGVKVVDHIKYKYQLTIDGHTAAWERPVWQLYSNSVVLKQESPLVQWYYNAIEAGKHYVNVGNDPEKLISIVESYRDEDLKEIADRSTLFVEENLMPEDMIAYIVIILQKYSALQSAVE